MAIDAILSGLKAFLSLALEFAKTWIGGVVIAFAIAWLWSGWRHDAACDAREAAARAAAEAAAEAKIAEWETAAKDIAQAATERLEEDARAASSQGQFITALPQTEDSRVPSAKNLSADFSNRPLFLERDYVGVVRAFDAAANPGADAARSAGEFRKAGAVTRSDRCAALKIWGLRNRAVASEANRRLIGDWRFYADVRRKFSAPKGE